MRVLCNQTVSLRPISYTYDGLQRLTGAAETPGTTYAYTYDLAGNRTEVRENGALVANLSYNDANQVIGWSYDAAGNLLSDGTSSRSYDALNRLVAQDSTSYASNGDGVLVGDGTTTYAQDLAAPLSQVLSDGTDNYVYGHDRLRALGGPWYVGDALGSVRQTLDDAGAVVATTSYDPWGTPQGTLSAPFGFTGELHSAGQVYLRARWYAPGQGRFVSEDPFAGWATRPYSLHAYQYAYSDPVRWTDPSGRCVPEWVPGGEPGCTLRAGIGQGRLDWQGAGDYAWDVVEGVGLPGAMAVDAIAGTNGTQQILDDAGTGTYLGVAFTGVTTLGSMQSGGAISNAALRGQVWLTSGSRLAVGVGLVGLGLNAADEGALWLRTLQGDCAAFGEWAALQQLGAADGLLPFGDVLAAGMLLPGRGWPANPNPQFMQRVRLRNLEDAIAKHPIFEEQAAAQRSRSTEELLGYDPTDPIRGEPFRTGKPDEGDGPWQGVKIMGGHHRLNELYQRYLRGEIEGETVVEILYEKADY